MVKKVTKTVRNDMKAKYFWESKTNWFGILTILSGSIELVAHYLEKGVISITGILLLVVGIINIVLRTMFTDSPVI